MPHRFRFSSGDDVALLQQVRQEVPFAATTAGDGDKGWQRVANTLREQGMQVETRTVRDRFFLLYRKYLDGNIGGLRRGSSDADYQQKEILLQQISEIVHQVDISLEAKLRRKSYDNSRVSNMIRLEDDPDLEIEPDHTSNGSDNMVDSHSHASFHMNIPHHSLMGNNVDLSLSLPLQTSNGSSVMNDVDGSTSHTQSNKRQRVNKDQQVNKSTQDAILQVLQSLETQKREEIQLREREVAQAEAKLQIEREALELAKAKEAHARAIDAARDEQMKVQLDLLHELLGRSGAQRS